MSEMIIKPARIKLTKRMRKILALLANNQGLSIKKIILNLELKEKYQRMLKPPKIAVAGYRPNCRSDVSLPEVIAIKFFPKGRAAWHGIKCENYPEYFEAKKKADLLFASYTRTLKKLLRLGLVEQNLFNQREYHITEKGLSVLKKFGLLNT